MTPSIHAQEEALFTRWQEVRPELVKDGCVHEADYLAAPLKLCFVLKDVNSEGENNWDLREYLRIEGGRGPTWNTVACWVHGIRHMNEPETPWNFYEQELGKNGGSTFRKDQLRHICSFNLKKVPGGTTADKKSILHFSREDSSFITQQYALYDADITICGGTGDMFHDNVPALSDLPWKSTSRGIYYFERAPGKWVIDFMHPEARAKDCVIHYALVDAVRELQALAKTQHLRAA